LSVAQLQEDSLLQQETGHGKKKGRRRERIATPFIRSFSVNNARIYDYFARGADYVCERDDGTLKDFDNRESVRDLKSIFMNESHSLKNYFPAIPPSISARLHLLSVRRNLPVASIDMLIYIRLSFISFFYAFTFAFAYLHEEPSV
jgi:hypothetical protein